MTPGDGTPQRVGVLRDDAVVDAGFDGDMIAFIEAGEPALEGARAALAAGARRRAARGCARRSGRARCATSSRSPSTRSARGRRSGSVPCRSSGTRCPRTTRACPTP